MNIMQSFQILLLICMLFGLLMGIWKGFGKSVIRFFVIIAMSLVSFFVAAPISQALVNTNISGLNINIAGVQFSTLNSGIIGLLEKVGPLKEMMQASPTFKAFIEQVPIMVLNIVVFLLMFFVLQAFSNLFSWLLGKLLLKKQTKTGEKPKKHRLLGGLVGLIQGVFVFAVIAVPVFGVLDTANDVVAQIDAYKASTETTEEESAEASATTSYVLVSDEETPEESQEEGNSSSKKTISINTEKIGGALNDFNNLTFVKVFRKVGIAKLENKVFANLTAAKVNGEKVSLSKELSVIGKVVSKADSITNLSASSTEKDFNNIRQEIDTIFESNLFPRVAEEVIRYASTKWSEDPSTKVFEVKKPDLGETGNKVFNAALCELKNITRRSLKETLYAAVDVMESASNNGIFKAVSDKQEGKDFMKTLAADDGKPIADIITIMTENDTLRAILPDLVQTGLDAVYPTLGIPKDESAKAEKVFGDIAKVINQERAKDTPSKTTLAKAIEQSMDKNDFNFDGVAADVKEQWFDDFANSQLSSLNNATADTISSALHTHTIALEAGGTRDFSDMANCNKLTQKDLAIKNELSKEEWKKDASNFATIFANIYKAYDSTTDENGNAWESGSEFDHFDFSSLGQVFDGLRHSYLLDDQSDESIRTAVSNRVSFNIVKAMLESDLLSGINVTQNFIDTIESNWDDENFKFEDAFTTLGSTVRILNQFNSGDGVSADAVKDLLDGLANETTKDAILDIIKDEDMFGSGSSDDSLTNAVTDIIENLADEAKKYQDENGEISEGQAEKEAKALNDALNLLNKSNKSDEEENNITEEEVTDAIDSILESDIVFETIVGSADTASSTDDGKTIKELIQEKTNSNDVDQAVEDKRNEIAANENLTDEEKAALNEKLDRLYELLAGSQNTEESEESED